MNIFIGKITRMFQLSALQNLNRDKVREFLISTLFCEHVALVLKMLTDCFGRRLNTSTAIVFYLIVVVNIYNLIIAWLLYDTVGTLFSSNIFEKALTIISVETIVSIFVIIFSTRLDRTVACFHIKYCIYGITVITLVLDILCTLKTANHVRNQTAVVYLRKRNQSESEALENLYPGIVIILGINLVFKLYATWKIIRLDRKHRIGVDDESTNNDDTEMNSPRRSTIILTPPSYDQCIESTPPPPYRDVQK